MTNIDPARLAAIFQALSSTELKKKDLDASQQAAKNPTRDKVASVDVKPDLRRDKQTLKKNIYLRLQRLKSQEGDYFEKAPAVVIKEILLWEFGEDLLQYPEFNFFLQTIVCQVKGHLELETYLSALIANVEGLNA